MENKSSDQLKLTVSVSISGIGEDEWDACLLETPGGDDHPFLRHRYLHILERSGAIDGRIWQARYLTVRDAAGTLIAAVPVFLKASPLADFIAEDAWVEALEKTGAPYYPKLQICAPFAPVGGPRLLIRRQAPPDLAMTMVRLITRIAGDSNVSGVHATFVNKADLALFSAAGWHTRANIQLQWPNRGYADFNEFLGTLTCRKRGMIRRERRIVAESGVCIQVLTGADLREEHMDVFASFYRMTFQKKKCVPHLPREFFLMLGERMADDILLVMASQGGRWVGATLNFLGRRTLFCRSWGGDPGQSLLHFEVTNYRGMECVIERGLDSLDGGMGGIFKLKRGYQPVSVWSAHHMTNPSMDATVSRFLAAERIAADKARVALAGQGPYRLAGTAP